MFAKYFYIKGVEAFLKEKKSINEKKRPFDNFCEINKINQVKLRKIKDNSYC